MTEHSFSAYLEQIRSRQAHIAAVVGLLYQLAQRWMPSSLSLVVGIARTLVQGYGEKERPLDQRIDFLVKASKRAAAQNPRTRSKVQIESMREFQAQLDLLRSYLPR